MLLRANWDKLATVGVRLPQTLMVAKKIPYAIERYINESKRLYGVLNKQLMGQKYVAGEYSIADMAILPWALRHDWQNISLEDYPYVQDYITRLTARPAVQKALEIQV